MPFYHPDIFLLRKYLLGSARFKSAPGPMGIRDIHLSVVFLFALPHNYWDKNYAKYFFPSTSIAKMDPLWNENSN